MRRARLLVPVFAVVLVATAGVTARRDGALRSPPLPVAAAPPAPSREPNPRATVTRVELLADHPEKLRFDAPSFDRAYPGFKKASWRSLASPYAKSGGWPRRALSVVALSTRDPEQKPEQAKGWLEDERTWNMSQASFDLRESFVAPPPSTIRYRTRLPDRAHLEVAPATLALPAGSITFEVAITTDGGAREVVDTLKVSAGEAPAWHDRDVDLSRFAGHDVEVELVATTTYTGEDRPSALWGGPKLVGLGPAPVPYSVLWVVVDTLRPDVLSAMHPADLDDARAKADLPAKEAWLPAMPTIAPNLDALSKRGVTFIDATSAATWTRPGTIALLAGARSTELGLDTTPWILPESTISRFYAQDPPLVPLLLRRAGVRAEGFVNNFFLAGYARAGVDPGLSRMVDHRHETLDTKRILRDALAFVDAHRDERFFALVNLNSPHNPYDPPDRCMARVPKPPLGPKDDTVRKYLAEISKDDEAIGEIVATLDRLKLRERTLVIVTADHGETLSDEHDWFVHGLGRGQGSTRFRHANAMFDETTRVPLVMSLPGKLPEGAIVRAPVSTTDIAPTVLSLLDLPVPAKMSGIDLAPLAGGKPGDAERPIVSEGRGARSVRVGRYRYVERDAATRELSSATQGHRVWKEELYDLASDPGERRNIAGDRPEIVERLRAALGAAMATSTSEDTKDSAALAGSRHVQKPAGEPLRVRLRFSGAGKARRVVLRAHVVSPEPGAATPTITGKVVGADADALRIDGLAFDLALSTLPNALVGVDLEVSPSTSPITWDVSFDDAPIPDAWFFGGPHGLAVRALSGGLLQTDTRAASASDVLPVVDAVRELGVFVVIAPGASAVADTSGDEAMREMRGLLEAWGYAKTSR